MTFAFIGVLQNAMDQTKEYWNNRNNHHICQNSSKKSPSRRPSLIYSISAVSDVCDYGLGIPGNVIDEMYHVTIYKLGEVVPEKRIILEVNVFCTSSFS